MCKCCETLSLAVLIGRGLDHANGSRVNVCLTRDGFFGCLSFPLFSFQGAKSLDKAALM